MRKKIPLMAVTFALTAFFAIGGVSAFFTDRIDLSSVLKVKLEAANESCIEMNYFDGKDGGLMPKDEFDMSPMITNISNEDCYVFVELTTPTILSLGVQKPVFSYQTSENWQLLSEEQKDFQKKEVFCYGKASPEILAPKESTDYLFTKMSFSNVPGNEVLSGQRATVGFKAFLVKASKISDEDKKSDSKGLYNLVSADDKEDISRVYVKENPIEIGKFKVEITKNEDENQKETEEKNEIVVENKGETEAVIFLKVRSLEPPSLRPAAEDLIYLLKDREEYVYGLDTTLKEGEKTDALIDKLEVEGFLEANVLSIQAKNLSDEEGPIDTDGKMDEDTLIRIYKLLQDGSGGFFTDEDSVSEKEHTKGGPGVKIEEVFDNSKPLTVGENDYEKRVTVRNISESPQYVRIKLLYSEDDIRDKISIFPGSGDFVKAYEFKDNLNLGWKYMEEDGEEYYVFENKLEPDDVTSPLFTHVKIFFERNEDVKDFDIFVEAESRKEPYI